MLLFECYLRTLYCPPLIFTDLLICYARELRYIISKDNFTSNSICSYSTFHTLYYMNVCEQPPKLSSFRLLLSYPHNHPYLNHPLDVRHQTHLEAHIRQDGTHDQEQQKEG